MTPTQSMRASKTRHILAASIDRFNAQLAGRESADTTAMSSKRKKLRDLVEKSSARTP